MKVYAIPNFECNLDCPHCTLHEQQIEFDRDRFFRALSSFSKSDIVVLFGGEPTLYEDRFLEAIRTGKVSSVSTNLMHLSDTVFQEFKYHQEISIGTSWNLDRFDTRQEAQWLKNLQKLGEAGIKAMVMITLTEDLLADSSYTKVHEALDKIQKTNGSDKVLFEHYIGDMAVPEYFEQCDRWLCRMHSDWKYTMVNQITKNILAWNCDCSNVYTLFPDGTMKSGCPHQLSSNVLDSCLSCEHSAHCRPCILQKHCSFPKRLYQIIKEQQL